MSAARRAITACSPVVSACAPAKDRRISRRAALTRVTAAAGLVALARRSGVELAPLRALAADPFTLGIASGDPAPDGVVLWTRLAPDPLNGGGMPPVPVPVRWRVCADGAMRTEVRAGTAAALPTLAHSVHVEVDGLEADRPYWYQFQAGDVLSLVGRTRTAPAAGSAIERLRFAFASCQNWEHGFFTAYQQMAAEELDLVVHLGDYIYEGDPQRNRPRRHVNREPVTLAEYRDRHALYKTDPDLQAAHAAAPWIVTWDDHEVEDNYAGSIPRDGGDPERFLLRRAAAYQAYYEHLPLRPGSMPAGPEMQIYRRLLWGDLAAFHVLDTRQYRTDQPCGDGLKPRCAAVFDPTATLLGEAQEGWLFDGLARSRGRWNVLTQQVMLAQVDRRPGPDSAFLMDQWDAYPAARDRLLRALAQRGVTNPVVITGDLHANVVSDLHADFDDPASPVVGTEFVGTSISSAGDGFDTRPEVEALVVENPWLRFYNAQRGYVRCELTPGLWRADFRVLAGVSVPGLAMSTRASFVVEDGKPGAVRVPAG